jgi:hypothetical protein
MQRRVFWYEFWLLWGIATGGAALELWRADFPREILAAQSFIPLHGESGFVALLMLTAQISIELAVATGVGLWAAHQVGLGVPVLEGWLRHRPLRSQSLRPLVLPVISIALLLAVFSDLPDLSVFHPNRRQRTAELTAFLQTPDGLKFQEQIDKLQPPPKRLTLFSEAILYAQTAVSTGVYDQLFMVSVFVLLLLQIRGTRGSIPDRKLLWAAIVIVTAIRATSLIVQQSTPSQIDQIILAVFPTHRDPLSLVAARGLVRMAPASLASGWLYVRHGIEAAILASFLSAVLAYPLLIHVLIHFA